MFSAMFSAVLIGSSILASIFMGAHPARAFIVGTFTASVVGTTVLIIVCVIHEVRGWLCKT